MKNFKPAYKELENLIINKLPEYIESSVLLKSDYLLASGENNLHESGGINQKKSKEKSHYQF